MRGRVFALLPAFVILMLSVAWSGVAGAEEKGDQRVTVNLSGHPVKGPAAAPVTIVVFSDYL